MLVVDGHNLLWRATFGFPAPIYSRDKTRRLTGLFGFFAILAKTIRTDFSDQPPEVVVVFDGPRGNQARQQAFAGYKAGRPKHEQALEPLAYLDDSKRGLDYHGIAWTESEDQEADDLIASLAASQHRRRPVIIMSSDRDFYQLIGPGVSVLGRRLITSSTVIETYGVSPAQWADFRALTGDPADGIPGVRGIGGKTAAELLSGNCRLETIPPEKTGIGRGRIVRKQLDQALAQRELIRLNAGLDLGDLAVSGLPTPALPPAAKMIEALELW